MLRDATLAEMLAMKDKSKFWMGISSCTKEKSKKEHMHNKTKMVEETHKSVLYLYWTYDVKQ